MRTIEICYPKNAFFLISRTPVVRSGPYSVWWPPTHSKTLNNRTGGANNEYRGGPGGPGIDLCGPGGSFSGSRNSGKPLLLLRLRKTPTGPQKSLPGPPRPPRCSFLASPRYDYARNLILVNLETSYQVGIHQGMYFKH